MNERILSDYLRGESCEAYRALGAHLCEEAGVPGVRFTVYAPGARRVSLLGECSGWEPVPMERREDGFWSLFYAGAAEGQMYKYRVLGADKTDCDRADPFAFRSEKRPNTASVIYDLNRYGWGDDEWLRARKQAGKRYGLPLSVYEVHAGSWKIREGKAEDGRFYTYEELSSLLIPYVKAGGYTHIELLPLTEHPLDASWGYQAAGYFSATSRYGEPRGLMALVDRCHQAGVGVLLDFVPAHFLSDTYALNQFDGTPLYESGDPDLRYSEWGTVFFDFTKPHVMSFLKSSVNYWLSVFHFDGIRFDAVSRLLYVNGREDRGVNEAGVWFLRSLNYAMQQRHPDALFIAEDSSSFLKVTAPVVYGGLGFDYKWDLGFMNDTLDYMMKTPAERRRLAERITFSMGYFGSELFLLPFSHDEVVHGKRTIIDKIYGSYEEKFPQLRLLYLYFFTHPGKKLTFMGCELAEFKEWDEKAELGWNLLAYPVHDAFHRFFAALQSFYTAQPALWACDYDPRGFSWVDLTRASDGVFVYARKAPEGGAPLYVALNFSERPVMGCRLPVETPGEYREVFATDEERFGGAGHLNPRATARKTGAKLAITADLPPFSGCVFQCEEGTV